MGNSRRFKQALVAAFSAVVSLVSMSLPAVQAADGKNLQAFRGSFFDFVDDPWKYTGKEEESCRFYPDGMIVLEDGIIKAYGPASEVAPKYPGVKTTTFQNRIIVPGMIDGHVHFPQTRVLGAYGLQLLPWLEEWIFPEEMKYKDPTYAAEGIKHYFDNQLAAGTTTVQDFGCSYKSAVAQFFDEATKRNMRVLVGIAGIDKFAPKEYTTPPAQFYADSKELIERYHGKGRNLYAITPRFAVGATPELMSMCEKLHKEYPDCWINTHVSENPAEVRNAVESFGTKDYLAAYEKYNLVGPKFTAGHGVWLSDNEMERLSKANASISVCPLSNTFLGSGLFRLGQATNPRFPVRMSFGTDMGGGDRFGMIHVLDGMYKVGMCNNTMLDGSVDPRWHDEGAAQRNKLNTYRAWYSVTLGGARGLYLDDKIGNFEPGKECDFVVLDWNGGPPATAWHQSLICDKPTTKKQAADLLFGVFAVGDDRAVDETWVMGKRQFKRGVAMGERVAN